MMYLTYDSSSDTIHTRVNVGTSPHPLACVDVQDNDDPNSAPPAKERKKEPKVDRCEHDKQKVKSKV
jgi:hypothetical protein